MSDLEIEDIVEFDTNQKLIKVKASAVDSEGTLILDVIEHLYRATRRWEASSIGIVFPTIVSREGGNILPGGVVMPVHVILQDGWKIQCPDSCSSVEIYGHLSSNDGKGPFVSRPNGKTISYLEKNKKNSDSKKWFHRFSVLLLILALIIIIKWIFDYPNQMEPYSAFIIVLFTLVQLIGRSKDA